MSAVRRKSTTRKTEEPVPDNTILVTDDEADVLELVASTLKTAGYSVIKAQDGAAALDKAREIHPMLVILDLMLPDISGLDVCKFLKSDPATEHIPIIMLTARAEQIDRILGLELGADDYITKPFNPRELVLRIKTVLRRAEGHAESDILKVGDIVVDRQRFDVRVKGKLLEMTPTEFKLLLILMERKGRVQSREVLLNDVWGFENTLDTRTVDTHVARLRDKLRKGRIYIETARGFGYRIKTK